MTIEEKAKAYDEALERAKELLGSPRTCFDINQIEDIFPELRESEDEKAKKIIASVFSEAGNRYIQKSERDIVLAYLEKQKEIPMPNSTELIEMWHKEKAMLKEKDFRGDEWRLAYNAFMDGFARGTCVKFEKQKEQKPAGCIEDSVKFEEGFKTGRESGLRDGQKYVLDNAESYGLCKPAEWSEEDTLMLTAIIQTLERFGGRGTTGMQIAWLKSLRPSWKPTEEQMGALNYAYCELFKREDIEHNILGPLQRLCDDLMKL